MIFLAGFKINSGNFRQKNWIPEFHRLNFRLGTLNRRFGSSNRKSVGLKLKEMIHFSVWVLYSHQTAVFWEAFEKWVSKFELEKLKTFEDRWFSILIGQKIRGSDRSIVSGNNLIGWLNWAWPRLDMSNIFQSTESKTNTKPKRNQKNRNRNTNTRGTAIVPGLDPNFEPKFIT